MPNESVTDFYTQLRKFKAIDDFEGLGQSQEITLQRITAASLWLRPCGDTWIDLGAGTGNLLKYGVFGSRPRCYIAVDMFYECQRTIEILCRRLSQRFVYIHKPEEMTFEEMLHISNFSVSGLAAINVLGNGQYDTVSKLKHAIYMFKKHSRRGFVTIPITYKDYLKETHLTRYQEAAIRHAFEFFGSELQIENKYDRELWVRW